MTQAINNQAENFLQNKFQVIRPLNHQVEIDFEFTDPSVFGANYALFNIKCEILSINNPSEYPIAPPLINAPAPSKMIQVRTELPTKFRIAYQNLIHSLC